MNQMESIYVWNKSTPFHDDEPMHESDKCAYVDVWKQGIRWSPSMHNK